MKFIPCNIGAEGTVSLGIVGAVASTVVVHMGGDVIRACLRSEMEQHQLVRMSAF